MIHSHDAGNRTATVMFRFVWWSFIVVGCHSELAGMAKNTSGNTDRKKPIKNTDRNFEKTRPEIPIEKTRPEIPIEKTRPQIKFEKIELLKLSRERSALQLNISSSFS
jgi:hypothetical protein